ncbi:MAG TPA: apolipoprotein N-acyltransferase [Burkholderiales bacterium]|nr:apolipoprotein N-acyltransferase [Burkholderiales bacterium]
MIALLAGAATVLAFAPVGFYPLALASFAVLIHLWMRAAPRACFWSGFAFGLGLFGGGVSWVYVSLSQFGGMPAPLAGLATFLFCAFIALFPAAAGWLQARVPAGDELRACLIIPAAWTLFEWLRGWILTGFPWLSAGYAATGWPPEGYAPVLGVYGLSFLTLSLAGILWALLAKKRIHLLVALGAVLGAGQALRAVDWTAPAGDPVRAALLQGNIEQEMKFRPERYARILETYARLAEETSARLIILPETAVPRFYDSVEPEVLARFDAAAKRNGGDLLLGVPYRESQAQDRYYNSVVTLGTAPRQVYHKAHLVPFGEFVPPGFGWVLHVLQIPLSDFSRGSSAQAPLAVAGQRVAVNICYEDAFGDEIARALPEATLLVNVSNVAWFGDSLAPAQHLQIARLRAIETGRMHLTATNTGVTAAIDRDGRVLAQLPQFAAGRLEINAQGYAGATPYVRLRDWPTLAGALLALAIASLIAVAKRSR